MTISLRTAVAVPHSSARTRKSTGRTGDLDAARIELAAATAPFEVIFSILAKT
jgi:hypothetical protein